MGYDLHITRRRHWSQKGHDVNAAEWLAIVQRDPDLRLRPDLGPHFAIWSKSLRRHEPWLNWENGMISVKNPDPPLIDNMVAIAKELRAKVQGDDGEVYDSGSTPPRPYEQSLWERLEAFLGRLRPTARPKIPLPPFGVGDRVTSASGQQVTVIAIDPRAAHGFGTITVRDDSGQELTLAMFAHGLRPLDAKGTGS